MYEAGGGVIKTGNTVVITFTENENMINLKIKGRLCPFDIGLKANNNENNTKAPTDLKSKVQCSDARRECLKGLFTSQTSNISELLISSQ